jgi:hypothetical protein
MPLTTITVLKATEFLTSTITEKFRGLIIERWTRYRAERFFRGFVEALGLELKSGVQTDELDNLLTKILTDDTKSKCFLMLIAEYAFRDGRKVFACYTAARW